MKRFDLKTNTVKKIIFPVIIIVLIAAILILRKDYSFMHLFQDVENLKAYILSFGNLSPFIFGAIQFLQVIISPIPGNITTVAGGAIFGFWTNLIISSIAIILGSAAAFGLARIFGRPFVEWIIGKEKVERYFDTVTKNKKKSLCLLSCCPSSPMTSSALLQAYPK